MTDRVAAARSFLFVPASRPERFAKALDSGADCIVVDLEDAVPPKDKAAARAAIACELPKFTLQQRARTLVRINAAGTDWHADDLLLVANGVREGLAGLMIPKAEAPALLMAARAIVSHDAMLIPLIESLEGLDAVDYLAQTAGVTRLAFGHLDFQLDLGMRCGEEEAELSPVRLALVAASRRAHLAPPIDGVTTNTREEARVASDALRARGFGFAAKLCIHPGQVAAVNGAFSASPAELEWATRVVEGAKAHEGMAFSLDGRMVDMPVIRLAQLTLQQSFKPEFTNDSD